MNTIQCVLADLPHLCPTSGFSGVRANMCETGMSYSFHLKIKVPSGLRTLKHSLKPCRNIPCQPPGSLPYFFACQPLFPFRTRCGGSKTTIANRLSGHGRAVKSAIISGLTSSILFPPRLDLSLSIWLSCRLSANTARLSERLNQNIRDPQETSNTGSILQGPPICYCGHAAQGKDEQTYAKPRYEGESGDHDTLLSEPNSSLYLNFDPQDIQTTVWYNPSFLRLLNISP